MNYILRLLTIFKFARQKIGGKWYYIEMADSGGGIAGPIKYWSQERPDDEEEILEVEDYTIR
jgi:hypothetical protein